MVDPIWVTGLGVVSPAGWSCAETWQAVASGRSATSRLERFPLCDAETTVGGVVAGYERIDPETPSIALACGMAALMEALEDAGVPAGAGGRDAEPPDMVIVANHGERRTPTPVLSGTVIGARQLTATLAAAAGAPDSMTVFGACAGGALAIGTAIEMLRAGVAECVVAGGADCLLREIDFHQFAGIYAMSSRACPAEEASCPFDLRRDGFVLAEGAGFLVLETPARAARRGVGPRAVVEGFGSAQTAYHMIASPPDGQGPAQAMHAALRDAGLAPAGVDYVNAHGTSTRDNDLCETLALHQVLGGHALRVPVSSSKSQLGHTMGAAGAIEAAICVRALEEALVPPTSNLEVPDPRCDLDYVAGGARPARLGHVMSNSFGFGGHCAALVLGAA